MKRASTIAAALGVTLFVGGSLIAGSEFLSPASEHRAGATRDAGRLGPHAQVQTVSLKVVKMYCAACPAIVRQSLERVDGVVKAEVFYRTKTARVTYDPAKCAARDLTAATAGIGYPSTVIE